MDLMHTLDGAAWAQMSLEEKRAAWNQLSDATRTAARDIFRQRCAAGALSPAISKVVRIKALTAVGDVEVFYPHVDISALPKLEPDEVLAVAAAEMIIDRARSQRAQIAALTPGTTRVAPVTSFDVGNAPDEIVILNPLIGG